VGAVGRGRAYTRLNHVSNPGGRRAVGA